MLEPLRMGLKHKIGIPFLKKILKQLLILLTTYFVDDALYALFLALYHVLCCFLLSSLIISFSPCIWQVFDCRLHGCSQDLIFPVSWSCNFNCLKLSEYVARLLDSYFLNTLCCQTDKQTPWNHPDEENAPCGPYCYHSVYVWLLSYLFKS